MGTDDTRACTACACDQPAGACQGTAQTFLNTTCAGTPITASIGACANVSGPISWKLTNAAPVNPQCQPTGVAPTGTVTPSAPVTICCMLL
jgi:hypothetical protein